MVDQATPANSTFQTADLIDGGDGEDVLNLVVTGNADVTLDPASVSNIETVNVRGLLTAGAVTVDAKNFDGATLVNADRATSATTISNLVHCNICFFIKRQDTISSV